MGRVVGPVPSSSISNHELLKEKLAAECDDQSNARLEPLDERRAAPLLQTGRARKTIVSDSFCHFLFGQNNLRARFDIWKLTSLEDLTRECAMTISMYQASVPTFIRMLNNLSAILEKAASHAEAKKIDPAVLTNSRLYPDMLPLARQIHIATDQAKGCGARLAGIEPPKFEDKEATFAELIARIEKTISFLRELKPAQIDGSEKRTVTLQVRGSTLTFEGMRYLLNFALPNFYFHVTTTYDILRHCGVELGKRDFLGAP